MNIKNLKQIQRKDTYIKKKLSSFDKDDILWADAILNYTISEYEYIAHIKDDHFIFEVNKEGSWLNLHNFLMSLCGLVRYIDPNSSFQNRFQLQHVSLFLQSKKKSIIDDIFNITLKRVCQNYFMENNILEIEGINEANSNKIYEILKSSLDFTIDYCIDFFTQNALNIRKGIESLVKENDCEGYNLKKKIENLAIKESLSEKTTKKLHDLRILSNLASHYEINEKISISNLNSLMIYFKISSLTVFSNYDSKDLKGMMIGENFIYFLIEHMLYEYNSLMFEFGVGEEPSMPALFIN